MARKSKKRFGIIYYHRGDQRFYVREGLTLEECKEEFRNTKVDLFMKDEATYVMAFEAMKSFSVYDGWCDYRAKEV